MESKWWSSLFHKTGVRHIRTEALQQRIRHTGEELHARRLQPINKPFNFNHLSPSFQMRGTSHITICAALHVRKLRPATKPSNHLSSSHFVKTCQTYFSSPTMLQRLKHEYTSLIAIGLYPVIEEFLQLAWQSSET